MGIYCQKNILCCCGITTFHSVNWTESNENSRKKKTEISLVFQNQTCLIYGWMLSHFILQILDENWIEMVSSIKFECTKYYIGKNESKLNDHHHITAETICILCSHFIWSCLWNAHKKTRKKKRKYKTKRQRHTDTYDTLK